MSSSVSESMHGRLMQALREYAHPCWYSIEGIVIALTAKMSVQACTCAARHNYDLRTGYMGHGCFVLQAARNGVHRCASILGCNTCQCQVDLAGQGILVRRNGFRLGQFLLLPMHIYATIRLCSARERKPNVDALTFDVKQTFASTSREEPQSLVCRSRQVKLESLTLLVRFNRSPASFALVLHVDHGVFAPAVLVFACLASFLV
jgi:hypothetical protein